MHRKQYPFVAGTHSDLERVKVVVSNKAMRQLKATGNDEKTIFDEVAKEGLLEMKAMIANSQDAEHYSLFPVNTDNGKDYYIAGTSKMETERGHFVLYFEFYCVTSDECEDCESQFTPLQ